MKASYLAILLLFIHVGCTTKYKLMVEGENFDALTKITDEKKVCFSPNGGENNTNLTFCCYDQGNSMNVYMKDKVLSSAIIQKTSGQNFNTSPSYCKANNKIVFQYFNRNNFDIYYINAQQGKAITQVTSTDENEYNPDWSSDGKMIIFEKGSTPKTFIKYTSNYVYKKGIHVTENQIWIKNVETGELKMVGQGSFPMFSPDDKYITYVKYDLNKAKTNETGTIWIMDIEGENQKQLTGPELGYASVPAWSPDGKHLVFQLTKNQKKDSDIYTIDIDGENLKQHTINKSQDFGAYWSEDGFIYFSSDRGGKAKKYVIWRFKANVS
ncbi:MAG: hypothetical protein WAT79_05595 [Saprospiraceae bacterium]